MSNEPQFISNKNEMVPLQTGFIASKYIIWSTTNFDLIAFISLEVRETNIYILILYIHAIKIRHGVEFNSNSFEYKRLNVTQ